MIFDLISNKDSFLYDYLSFICSPKNREIKHGKHGLSVGPDLEIRGGEGGGGVVSKKHFFGPSGLSLV